MQAALLARLGGHLDLEPTIAGLVHEAVGDDEADGDEESRGDNGDETMRYR